MGSFIMITKRVYPYGVTHMRNLNGKPFWQ